MAYLLPSAQILGISQHDARKNGLVLKQHRKNCFNLDCRAVRQRQAGPSYDSHRHQHALKSAAVEDAGAPSTSGATVTIRDDDVLPDSLGDALGQASEATSLAIERGAERCIVEVLLPEFWDPNSGAIFAEEGDQQRFWKLTRRFLEGIAQQTGKTRITAIYPDMGVAAMLANLWKDLPFRITSLNDRFPVDKDDEIVVIAAPDPLSVEDVIRVARMTENVTPLVLFNPRLASGDVGVGLNIRRLRTQFLSTFLTTYSLRPVGDVGSVYRRYPGLWQVFVADPDMPGRFKLLAERSSRPAGESLEVLLQEALGGEEGQETGTGENVFMKAGNAFASMQRFMKQLSQ